MGMVNKVINEESKNTHIVIIKNEVKWQENFDLLKKKVTNVNLLDEFSFKNTTTYKIPEETIHKKDTTTDDKTIRMLLSLKFAILFTGILFFLCSFIFFWQMVNNMVYCITTDTPIILIDIV
uniref:Uncharacterized protein n=1 Tax=Strongyloides venezuelensis TaxID=75913 RepID=A0A0K0F6M5_STRVS